MPGAVVGAGPAVNAVMVVVVAVIGISVASVCVLDDYTI